MTSVGIAIICKTPEAGKSKTRLSPPLSPAQCAAISSCFIRDLATTIEGICATDSHAGYAVYTPVGSEAALRKLIPPSFGLIVQSEGDLGERLMQGIRDIVNRGHCAAIIVNSDSPTLPPDILMAAAHHLLHEDCVVLSPAIDGGYTFIGLRAPYARLFEDIPWSTDQVHALTVQRAREIGLPLYNVDPWYDVDDATSLNMLRSELSGETLPFATKPHAPQATATRQFLDGLAVPAMIEACRA